MKLVNKFSKWSWFTLEELFDIKKGKRLTKENMLVGSTPFVGSSDSNNGWTDKVGQEPIHKANTITVSYNGSVAEAFYQPQPFWASDDVNVLYPKFELTLMIALFVTTIIRSEKYRYNYGRKWHLERMRNSKIRLPVDDKGEPAWSEIEESMSSLTIISKLDMHNKSSLKQPKNVDVHVSLKSTSWKWFKYRDLFEIERGRGPRKQDLDGKGNVPVITSSDSNNGLTAVTNELPTHAGNTITVNRNGSVAEAFYQPAPFCSTEDVHVFTPKFSMNKYIAMFLCTLIRTEKYRYSYGRKWGIARMQESTIKLPVTPSGEPDWEFMENYLKSLPYSSSV